MKRAALVLCAVAVAFAAVVAGWMVGGVIWAATDALPVAQTSLGYQVVEWDWASAADGTASALTDRELDGILWQATMQKDPADEVATEYTLTVKATHEFAGVMEYSSDISSAAMTSTTSALKCVSWWSTSLIPVSSRLRLDLTGAKDAGGAGAKGHLRLVIAPWGDK